MIKTGDQFTYTSPYTEHKDRIGQKAVVLASIDPSTYDYDEVGPMFRAKFEDGSELTVWPEEIDPSLILT